MRVWSRGSEQGEGVEEPNSRWMDVISVSMRICGPEKLWCRCRRS